jgi:4-hydroxy-tetrahydrodipicolinate synthase
MLLLPGKQIQYNLAMGYAHHLTGVFAAVITPLKPDLSPDLDGLITLIQFLAKRGCHGVLLMGTTGEGPSFSITERLSVYQAAVMARQNLPGLQFLAGTGTPSLEDTIFLTKAAFDQGYDGVVVLPPYYYRKATDDGLFTWFSQVLEKSVPMDGVVLGYHIPAVSGVGLSLDLLSRLKDSYPTKFTGIKDSSGDPEWARSLGVHFGSDLTVLNGNDRLFSLALKSKASGCITAMANLISPLHRMVWDNFQAGINDEITQGKLSSAREVFDQYPPMPPLIKLMLTRLHGFPAWVVKPPLLEFNPDLVDVVLTEFSAVVE